MVERHFYGSRHGKGPSDGAGAVVKSGARRAVMGMNVVINNAEDLYNFGKEKLESTEENMTIYITKGLSSSLKISTETAQTEAKQRLFLELKNCNVLSRQKKSILS